MFKRLLVSAVLFMHGIPCFAQSMGGGTTNPYSMTSSPSTANGIDIRTKGAVCDGTTDDTVAINATLVAAKGIGGGYAIIPNGYTCAFASTLILQTHVTLKIMPGATLKFTGTSGDEILGQADGSVDERQNIEGPGLIDSTSHTGGGNIVHYMGGSFDLVENISIKANSSSLTAFSLNGSTTICCGAGNWRLSRIDGVNINGTIGTVLYLYGDPASLGGPTNNSFYNISASTGVVVANRCVNAPRNNDTEYFYNLNCSMTSPASGVVIGAAQGLTYTISSGTYNTTTGLVSLTLSSSPPSSELQVGDMIRVAGLTGTGAYASLDGTWTATTVSGTTVTYTAATGLGTTTITGGSEATIDTDAWGYHFDNYVLSGGVYGVILFESHDNSFIGGDDAQGQTSAPGIQLFAGPGHGGAYSVNPTFTACHTMLNYNSGYLCVNHTLFTVATLPIGSSGGAGPWVVDTNTKAYVTDATSCTFMGALTGGGSLFCPVVYNGSSWVAE